MRIVGRTALLCSLFTLASFAQNPQVESGRNVLDGTPWAVISVVSDSAIAPVPVLEVHCSIRNSRPSIRIVLVSGPLKPHLGTGLEFGPPMEWLLPTKLDEGTAIRRSWVPSDQRDSYVYDGHSQRKFLDGLLAAKTFYVEFERFGERGKYIASFDVSHLREALASRPECAAK